MFYFFFILWLRNLRREEFNREYALKKQGFFPRRLAITSKPPASIMATYNRSISHLLFHVR
jgi:hypothetical protein